MPQILSQLSSQSVSRPQIHTQSSQGIPTFLITGLLGSGKTTALLKLLAQKPANEFWAIIINEFGEIGLDDKILENTQTHNVKILNVQGGCICCTAGHQLNQAIQNLLSQAPKIDKLWIEPTGLGHPAGILDTLSQTPQVHLKTTLATLTPKQLTAERWQKSAVMRDIATLSDVILLTQTDLAKPKEIQQSLEILHQLYPAKTHLWQSYNELSLTTLVDLPPIAFKIRENVHFDQPLQSLNWPLSNSKVKTLSIQMDARSQQILAFGFILAASHQFNRVLLKTFFERNAPHLIRAKGLVRTGKNWQLLQWQGAQLSLSDFAWRQDSRLELLLTPDNPAYQFAPYTDFETLDAQSLPAGMVDLMDELLSCIHQK